MKAETKFSLKDQLFNRAKVEFLAAQFVAAYADFPSERFVEQVVAAFPQLELKERIAHITSCLHTALPQPYPVALDIVLRALPPELDPTLSDDDFGDFIIAPLSLFVATYGCEETYLEMSLAALRETTKRFSAEYAIRFFINKFPAQTMQFLADCAEDDNYHVRRLASEGTRPKLPWAQKLTIDYQAPLSILDKLHTDKTRFVTRSVANHLNDIAKLEPALVVKTVNRWRAAGQQADKEMAFIAKHSLRTLVKQGDQEALTALGYGEKPQIRVLEFSTSTPAVVVGDAFLFELIIEPQAEQALLIDYMMQFAGNGNKAGGSKVFKLKQVEATVGKQIRIKKKHPMRLMTTRRLYVGTHTITLQVNGQAIDTLSFELKEAG